MNYQEIGYIFSLYFIFY